MKKLSVVSILALMAFTVFACGGSGGSGTTGPSSILQGTFVFKEATVTEGGTTITVRPPDMTGSYTFTADGRFTGVIGGRLMDEESWAGSFTVNGLTVTLNYDNGTVEKWSTSPDRNQLSSTLVEGGTSFTLLFVRV